VSTFTSWSATVVLAPFVSNANAAYGLGVGATVDSQVCTGDVGRLRTSYKRN
jgi:hypothetical protein